MFVSLTYQRGELSTYGYPQQGIYEWLLHICSRYIIVANGCYQIAGIRSDGCKIISVSWQCIRKLYQSRGETTLQEMGAINSQFSATLFSDGCYRVASPPACPDKWVPSIDRYLHQCIGEVYDHLAAYSLQFLGKWVISIAVIHRDV